jgi:hypothetical protein
MPEHRSEDEHIFTVRLWLEPGAVQPVEQKWRGQLYHSQSKSSRNFVGLERLFDHIRQTLSRTTGDVPRVEPRENG